MSEPLITTIIPVYNVEKYLDDCVESVVRQSYTNLQIILVNDGSTDDSGTLCDQWQKRDKRIVVFHQKNQGVSAARNLGMQHAEGDYITFLDSDDLYHWDFIRIMYHTMKKYEVDVVQCDIGRFKDGISPNLQKEVEKIKIELVSGREINKRIYTSGNIIYTIVYNKMYRHKVLEDKMFPVGKIHEDTYTLFRWLYPLEKVALVSAPLQFYRSRPNSIMTSAVSERNLDMLDAYEERLLFYKAQDDRELYALCLVKYMYAITVLYGKTIGRKDQKMLLEQFYMRAEHVYSKMKKEKEISKKDKTKAKLYLKMPLTYCRLVKVAMLCRRGIGKVQCVMKRA